MGTRWGRKETIIWPPHVPILSYAAVATAVLCTLLFIWQRLAFSLAPLERSYITEYTPRHIERRNPERCCQRWSPASDERCCKGTL